MVLRFDGPLGPEGYGGALRAQFMAAFGGKSHTTRLRLSEMHPYSRSVGGNCSAQGRSPDGTMNPDAEGA